ncbi:MAG TPA: glycosyltransferase family 4 protein [Tepidisphaeraceae bacterium]|nr:glycosyltransferase family 4 protein [Tepidisphaeraceae bacterium]
MNVGLAFPGCHRRGGVERVVLESANFLAARGHQVNLISCQRDTDALHPDIRHHAVTAGRSTRSRLYRFRDEASRIIASLSPAADVVAGFGVQSPRGSVTWVQSVHRAWIEIARDHRSLPGRLKQLANPFHRAVLGMEQRYYGDRQYGRLIALTEGVKSDLMRCYGVPGGDIEIIPNGFSRDEFNVRKSAARRAAVRRELGIADDARAIVFVANELERKGFGPLLQALRLMKGYQPILLVAGRVTPGRFSREIERLGRDRVRFVGSTSDVAAYYAAADVFALPTQYEAWGLVIVEALACGLPVLTSRLAGASVAVSEGRSGLLLDDPRDSTEIASKLSRLLDGLGASPQEISDSVAIYSWNQVLPRYEEVLAQAAAGSRPAAAVAEA